MYLWRAGALVCAAAVCKGYLSSLQVVGGRVFCGGAGGVVKVLDARTLTVTQVLSVAAAAARDLGAPSVSIGVAGSARPGSAGTPRSASRSASAPRPRSSSGNLSQPPAATPAGPASGVDSSVVGLAVAVDRRSVRGARMGVLVTTAAGVALRLDVDADGSTSTEAPIAVLFHYHVGCVDALARFGRHCTTLVFLY